MFFTLVGITIMDGVTGLLIADFTDPLELLILFKMVYATVLGVIIGYHRRLKHAGIRTFTLITLGATIFTIISADGILDNSPTADKGRIIAQIVSGIGFIGAGVIWKDAGHPTGLTTAAGIWAVSAIGIAVGLGRFFLATAGAILIIVVFNLKRYFAHLEVESEAHRYHHHAHHDTHHSGHHAHDAHHHPHNKEDKH